MSSLPVESYHLNDSQKHLRVTLITCLTVAVAFVLLRVLVRLRIQRQFNPDDYLLLLAVCGFSLMTGFLVHAIDAGGFGRPTDELPLDVLLCGIKYLVFGKTSYVLTLIITNLSIALLQLRISGGLFIVFNRLHYTSIAINVAVGLYEFFRVLFQCFPVEKMWTPTMDKGHCADTDGITTGTYVYSAINVALTWYYALALVPLIWKLQLKTAVKLSSIFVLGVGILASIATIIRFKYLLDFSTTSNPLKVFIPIARWCWIEMSLGISAASISAFRPLLTLIPCCASDRAAKNAPRDNDASEPPRKLRRGYTFQLSEIDSMDLKQDETPIIRCQSYEAPSSISVTTPGTLNEDRRVSYFAKEISMEAGEKDLERGV